MEAKEVRDTNREKGGRRRPPRTSAVVWALLDAALPSADAPHVAVLRAALAGAAAGDAALAADCAAASAKFAEALALRAAA